MKPTLRALVLSLLVASSFLGWSTAALADVEPNNTCETAEDLGAVTLPLVIEASLSPAADIDFYALAGTPGDLWVIDHEGASTGAGTLPDPLLGVFDSACQLIALNDDTGSLNSRVVVEVPADGHLVVAATAYPDFEFVGSGEGSYRLTVDEFAAIGTISGRLVDAVTGDPLPGVDFPFAGAYLVRCDGVSGCFDFIAFQSTGADGGFLFATDFNGAPLGAGTYQVQAFASVYDTLVTEPFAVAADESVDLGDLALEPFRFIGSLSGRVVDAQDGTPLSGEMPPFAFVSAERCDVNGCLPEAFAIPGADGRFHLDGTTDFVRTGTYQLRGFADQYVTAVSATFDVGEGQDFEFGDLALEPLPLQFGDVEACTVAPGGTCRYALTLRNRAAERFDGAIWSLIVAFGTGSPTDFTNFQVGRLGTVNPKPEKLNVKPGEEVRVEFQFDVPQTVAPGAFFCAEAYLGQDPSPLFNVLAERFLFCIESEDGTFAAVSEKEGRKRLRELRKHTVRP